jgi:hypothetical protein
VLIVTTVWSIAAAPYFALRKDDTQPIAEKQAGYEKRIADLRTEFDRATNQQLLDQKQIQQKLDALLQRQAALERHTPTTADDQLATGSTSAKEPEASSRTSRLLRSLIGPRESQSQRVFATGTDWARNVFRQRSHSTCWTAIRSGPCTSEFRRAHLCA